MYPAAGHGQVEFGEGGRTLRLGQLDESSHLQKVANAQAALAAAIADRLFVLDRVASFEFVYHFQDVDAWLEYMATRWSGAVIGPDLIARVRGLFAPGHGELRIRREIHAARLERV
jgi:hypothetical protein